ncbi:MAG: hypothetical protein HN337_05580 [Deltaproteobacteria bacterium]|jgi:hypothetical protein|nr:hypothetical protein [Deltaproteobacteria bacterium]
MKHSAIVLCVIVGYFIFLTSSYAGEKCVPSIVEVQKRAIAHARLDPSEISGWQKRAKLQALLPKIQLEYERRVRDFIDIDINDSVYVGSSGVVVGPEEGSYSYNNDADQNIGVKAVWSFNESIFNPDMLNVSAEARRLSRERQSLLAEVTKNYYDRERLAGDILRMSKLLDIKPGDHKVERQVFLNEVAVKEAIANIDSYTGGWFSEKISECDK